MRSGRSTASRPRGLRSARVALLIVTCAQMVPAGTLAAGIPVEDAETDTARNDAGASDTEATVRDPGRPDRPCFQVSVPVWPAGAQGEESYVSGWASVDRTAHSEGLSCQVRGWAPIEPCGRTIPAYVADCPDGVFTFTRTEADCYYVVGCRDPQEAKAGRGPR